GRDGVLDSGDARACDGAAEESRHVQKGPVGPEWEIRPSGSRVSLIPEVFFMKDVCPSPEDQGPLPSLAASSSAISYVAVMPEQFFSLPWRYDKGVAALMYAVLEDALFCFTKQFVDNGLHAQSLAKETERWFFSDNDRWPFSFVNICLVLRIDPEYVRLRL